MDKITLIAEAGWNHLGDMDLAKRMIESAAEAGADYIKFQTWKVSRLKPGPWDTDGRREIYEKAELSEYNHWFLKETCEQSGIKFLTSCFSEKDLEFVRTLMSEVKIPSPEASNVGLVVKAKNLFDRVYLSTGACVFDEWDQWVGIPNITLMHCVSSYPCLSENFHNQKFNRIKYASSTVQKRFGFSGHYPGIWDAIFAISNGATVIEKHFTLDHDLPGRDNKFAILPDELCRLREYVNYFVQAPGELPIDEILECEEGYRKYHKGRWDKV